MSRARNAVLFDLDGTLLDTAPDLVGTLNDMRAARDLAPLPLEETAPMCSYGARGMLARGLGLYPEDAAYHATFDAFIDRYRERLARDTQPFAGMRELIAALTDAGYAWGVVTNKVEELAVPLMSAMRFSPEPGCVIGGDTAGVAKPDPAPMYLACERIAVAAPNSIYIGDSERDIAAGRAAGMATIGAAYGYIPPEENIHDWNADRVVERVADLFDVIRQLRAPQ